MKGYWYKIEVERFLSVGLSVAFAFFSPQLSMNPTRQRWTSQILHFQLVLE